MARRGVAMSAAYESLFRFVADTPEVRGGSVSE